MTRTATIDAEIAALQMFMQAIIGRYKELQKRGDERSLEDAAALMDVYSNEERRLRGAKAQKTAIEKLALDMGGAQERNDG